MAERIAVTVAVDGSAASLAAVRWAAVESARRDTALRLVHVCDVNEAYLWSMPSLPEHLIELSRPMVGEAVELARRTAPGLRVSEQVLVGPVVRTLLVVSETAGLLVLGRSGQGALAAQLVGSTTNRMAAHAHCPVVAVPATDARQTGSAEPGRVVVGLADRPTRGAALDFAIAEAARHAVPLLVVRAWHGPAGIGIELVLREDEQLAQLHQLLAGHLARNEQQVMTSSMVRAGTPSACWADCADQATCWCSASIGTRPSYRPPWARSSRTACTRRPIRSRWCRSRLSPPTSRSGRGSAKQPA
jgi:nucleotide-binding universal stress UspA family protein